MSEEKGYDPADWIDLFCRKSQAVKSRASRGRKQELSISAQETLGRRVAALLGKQVRHVWKEVGSASRFRRKGARTDQDQALAAVVKGEVGALWCYRLDRWDRRGAGAILHIIEPEDGIPRRILFGWNEETGRPELDSSNKRDRGELIRSAERAREETEILSERIKNTKDHQRANGEWVNARAPYGLEVVLVETLDEEGDLYDERRLRVSAELSGDPKGRTKAEIARLWHTLPVTDGLSLRSIAERLSDEGVPNPSGTAGWAFATGRDIINNPAYAGWQTTGRQEGQNQRRRVFRDENGDKLSVMAGEALVTDEEQLAAKEAVQGEEGIGVPGDGSEHSVKAKHLMTDASYCESCEGSMPWAGTGYGCWKTKSGQRAACEKPAFVARKAAEEYIGKRWQDRLIHAEPDDPILIEVAKRYRAAKNPKTSEDEAEVLDALARAETALKRVWADRKGGLYDGPSEEFFKPDLDEATERVTALQSELERVRGGSNKVDVSWIFDPDLVRQTWERADEKTRRMLLRLAIDEIWISKAAYQGQPFDGDSRITINWHGEPPARRRVKTRKLPSGKVVPLIRPQKGK
ncbi:recombinase family protein [Streptomyces bacillaris]|uniref:recombinase family protein n=1 Tax=Streptomyces bacillaris TaxID=68179 RepID=UPI00380C0AE2